MLCGRTLADVFGAGVQASGGLLEARWVESRGLRSASRDGHPWKPPTKEGDWEPLRFLLYCTFLSHPL